MVPKKNKIGTRNKTFGSNPQTSPESIQEEVIEEQ
jgi:hypothetical protein